MTPVPPLGVVSKKVASLELAILDPFAVALPLSLAKQIMKSAPFQGRMRPFFLAVTGPE